MLYIKNLAGDVTPIDYTPDIRSVYRSVHNLFPDMLCKLFLGEKELTIENSLHEEDVLSIFFYPSRHYIRIYEADYAYLEWGKEPHITKYDIRISDMDNDTLCSFYRASYRVKPSLWYRSEDVIILHNDFLREDGDKVQLDEKYSFDNYKDLFRELLIEEIEDYTLQEYIYHKLVEDWEMNFS